MQLSNTRKAFMFVFIILIICGIFSLNMYYGINSDTFEIIMTPLRAIGTICFFIMPFTFVALLSITIVNLIRKDYTSFNLLYPILILITLTGYIDGKMFLILPKGINFYNIDFIALCFYIIMLYITTVITLRIYYKNNTKLYSYVTLAMLVYFVFYLWKVVNIGI